VCGCEVCDGCVLLISCTTAVSDQLIGSSSSVQANKLFRLGRIVRIMRLLRLIRLFQLFRFAYSLKLHVSTKPCCTPDVCRRKGYFARVGELLQTTFVLSGPVTRLFKLFLLSILVAHLVGGLWFFIGDLRESGSWLDLDPTLRSAELSRQYFASVYWVRTPLVFVPVSLFRVAVSASLPDRRSSP
jgi:hypothetical protein